MFPGELKPILAALALPPLAPLLLIVLGGLFALGRRPAMAWLTAGLGTVSLWLLSCSAVAVWLAGALLPAVPAASAGQLAEQHIQAIVVLGGGVEPAAPEYGRPQPSTATLVRLNYGAHLARQTRLPLAFSGGVGWAAAGTGAPTEAQAAATTLRDWGLALRWNDALARDTAENALRMRELLQKDGVTRIALVTHAWHMPRARLLFERSGFLVLPAPTGFVLPQNQTLLQWMPSSGALDDSRAVLREWLALQLLR